MAESKIPKIAENIVNIETGSAQYVTSYTLRYIKLGRICVFSVKFTPNTNITSSTGPFAVNKLPMVIDGDSLPVVVSRQDPNVTTLDEAKNRFLYVHAEGTLKAVGVYSIGVVYSASGAYVTND